MTTINPASVPIVTEQPIAAAHGLSRPARLITRIALVVAVLIMVGHFAVYVVYTANLVQFPFDYDQGEGFELNDTVLLSQGQWPYRDNAVYPFYASNYPPLYHVLLVPFVWLFGPAYWYGRLFGFVATLITAGAIGWAVYQQGRQRIIALLAGLCYLASSYIYHIGPLFRQHITMVMFETLAIVAVASLPLDTLIARLNGHQRRTLWLGLLALLAAGFTKQLAIVTMAAFFAYLFLRSPRRAIAYGAVLAVIGGGLFLALNIATGGQWWTNIITANVNGYIASQFVGLAKQFFGLHGVLLILAILYALYELYFARLSVYTIWFACAAIGSALAGKWGAGDSYFATLIAAMCVLAGLFASRMISGEWPIADNYLSRAYRRIAGRVTLRNGLTPLTALGFILYGLAVIHLPLSGAVFGTIAQTFNIRSNTKFPDFYDAAGWTQGYATIGQLTTTDDIVHGWQIVVALKADPRPALSEEAAFAFQAGKPIVTNPTQLLNLYDNHAFDPTALVAMIRDHKFGVVVFRASFYPPPVLEAVATAYQPLITIPMNGYEYQILVPKPVTVSKPATSVERF